MNSFILSLLINSAAANVRGDMPPTNGSFFYMQVDNQVDQNGAIQVKDTQHMFHTNLFAGSEGEKLELWLSSTEHQMALFESDCTNCDLNGGWNRFSSDTSEVFSQTPYVETGFVYNQEKDGKSIEANGFAGFQTLDDIKIVDPTNQTTIDTGDLAKPKIELYKSPILSINMAAQSFQSMYDGYIGFAPWQDTYGTDPKSTNVFNFLYNLKYWDWDGPAIIDHLVVSVFITQDAQSSVKFGSYDPQAILDTQSLTMMKTRSTHTWAVKLHRADVFGESLSFSNTDTFIVYEPQLPYLYLPSADFLRFIAKASTFYTGSVINCNYNQRGSCKFSQSCDQVIANQGLGQGTYKLGVGDNDGEAYEINVSFADMLLDGPLIGEAENTCFLAVFKSTEIEQNTWFMGNQMMRNHYTVFDATAADEKGEDYITFGIANKAASHAFDYQQGAVQNIFYDDGGKEIPSDKDKAAAADSEGLSDTQRRGLTTVLAIFLYALFNGAAAVVASYFFYEFNEIYTALHVETNDYYALSDFGYFTQKDESVNPLMMLYILCIPEIWNQIGIKVIISTLIYITATVAGFLLFMPADIVTSSVYLHYLIYLLKQVELDPNNNLVEIVMLEQAAEKIYTGLLVVDISLAASALTIGFITMVSLFAKFHL